jgi:4-amino-4-deoxy-L-arabinose transferase-like glycosyltransferase
MAGAAPVRLDRAHRVALGGLLALYLLLGLRLLFLLPLWGGVSDEAMHFGFCKYIAVRGTLPLIGEGYFPDTRSLYTDPGAGEAAHHPPGYYFLGSLVYRLVSHRSLTTQNYAIRLMSLLLGLAAVLSTYAFVRETLPEQPDVALAAVAGMAVFPHWLMMSSVIYVEVCGGAALMGALWLLARYRRDPARVGSLLGAGVLTGLLALTKMTMLPFCLALTWIAVTAAWRASPHAARRLRDVAVFLAAAAAVSLWWYVRNVQLYGQLFPTSVVAGQLASSIKVNGGPADMVTLLFIPMGRFYYWLALTGTFHYFWGPDDWLPDGCRPWCFTLAALTWVMVPPGLWRAVRAREVGEFWRTYGRPFVAALVLLFFFYLRWTVTTAIQAKAEFGKFIMPSFGLCTVLFALAATSLVGTRRMGWVVGAFVVFFLCWDLITFHHLATVLIPRYVPLVPVP